MPALDRTRALIADLATAIGLPSLPADATGGYHVTIGDGADIYIYGGDDETILVVAPIGPLPLEPEYGLMVWLLRKNLYDSDWAPFQIAADDTGVLIFWGRLGIADLTGATLGAVLDRIAALLGEIRAEVGGEAA